MDIEHIENGRCNRAILGVLRLYVLRGGSGKPHKHWGRVARDIGVTDVTDVTGLEGASGNAPAETP